MNIRQLLEQADRPFAAHPRVDRYFPAATIEDARGRLTRSIQRGDGPGVVIGSAGTGKSLLLQALAAEYHDRFDVVLLACSQICTRRALLQAILFELGLPYRQRDEGQLRLALLDHLLSDEQSPEGLLLLVDEAQSLSVTLLEELRMMTNLVRGGAPRVRLVLAGSPVLEETFARPELESFSQRLAARCYLGPLGRDETTRYVRAQLAAAGGNPDVLFAPEAVAAVVEATDGVPRLVNQLCDRALWMADAAGLTRVDRQTVETAWADLQQLPTPWDGAVSTTAGEKNEVIEFGSLADDSGNAIHADDEVSVNATAQSVEVDTSPVEPLVDEKVPVAGIASTSIADELSIEELGADEITPTRSRDGADGWTGRSPQVFAPDADEAVNPFSEQFDEEEIVLDNFAAWDTPWLDRQPQVENVRDRQFAARVQEALDATAAAAPYAAGMAMAERSEPTGDRDFQPADASAAALPPAAADQEPEPVDVKWPPLRLAIVSEPAMLQPVPLFKSSGQEVVTAAAFDPVMPEEEDAEFCRKNPAEVSPFAASAVAAFEAAAESSGPQLSAAPILVIEDDPTEAGPPVRREDYRLLFSRLRGA